MCVPTPPEPPRGRIPPFQVKPLYAIPAVVLALIVAVFLLSQASNATNASKTTASPAPTTSKAVPTASPSARLTLKSEPSGATVLVDGVEKGKTPLVLEELNPGSHKLRLTLLERQQWQGDLVLSPEESRSLEINLAPIATPTAAPTATAVPRGPAYPVAVMVENHVDARPQSGLSKADIVYEAPVEFGIGRFMAIYIDGQAKAIGPVRSARHYFVYIADEFNAAYVNIGWSPQAYNALQATGLLNLDEIQGDPGFWRSNDRYAPHNAYTSTDLLRSNLKQQKPGTLAGFQFKDGLQPPKGKDARTVTVVRSPYYYVEYFYDEASKLYSRSMDGSPHRDADTGDRVSPRNVVVQFVKTWVIDDVGRIDMAQVGEGKALYFRDGVATEGIWRKASLYDVTHWLDADGKPMEFPTGKTWVEVVPQESKVAY